MSDVDDLGLLELRTFTRQPEPARPDEVAILPGQAGGAAPLGVDQRNDLLVHQSAKHHLDDIHGGRVRDAQAVDKAGLDIQPLQQLADLRAAAMHHHRVHANEFHQHHVAREGVLQRRVHHRRAAVLDDDRRAVKLADIRQRLDQDLRRVFA